MVSAATPSALALLEVTAASAATETAADTEATGAERELEHLRLNSTHTERAEEEKSCWRGTNKHLQRYSQDGMKEDKAEHLYCNDWEKN